MAHNWFSDINWRRMKAGKEPPPFIPDPHAVYAKDVLDIEQFSTVKGVSLDSSDSSFYNRFNTGAVSIPWQEEMVDTRVFEELNVFHVDEERPGRPPSDLDLDFVPEPEPKGCLPYLFSKLKTKSSAKKSSGGAADNRGGSSNPVAEGSHDKDGVRNAASPTAGKTPSAALNSQISNPER